MKKLLIATRNKGKFSEIKKMMSDTPFLLFSLDDAGIKNDVQETGKTFEENARLKAEAYGNASGMMTIADDSGLEVDALDGAPGIYSARYTEGSDTDRVYKILRELEGVPDDMRSARFKSVIVLYNPETKESHVFEGACEGYITNNPRGSNGFGYDPIFESLDLDKTFGEATQEEKNQISHRGQALLVCKEFLTSA